MKQIKRLILTFASLSLAGTASAQVLFDNGTFSNDASIGGGAIVDATTFSGESVISLNDFSNFGTTTYLSGGQISNGEILRFELYIGFVGIPVANDSRLRPNVQLGDRSGAPAPAVYPAANFGASTGWITVDGLTPTGNSNSVDFSLNTWQTVELDLGAAFNSGLIAATTVTDPSVTFNALRFQGNGGTYNDVFIRNVSVIPEPSTSVALMGAAALAFVGLRRRRAI
jgi:hypothetical protein